MQAGQNTCLPCVQAYTHKSLPPLHVISNPFFPPSFKNTTACSKGTLLCPGTRHRGSRSFPFFPKEKKRMKKLLYIEEEEEKSQIEIRDEHTYVKRLFNTTQTTSSVYQRTPPSPPSPQVKGPAIPKVLT